jgi:hypothetical protein
MGCDIAMYAEVLRHRRWALAEPLERNPAFDPEHPREEPEWKPAEVFGERNYALFAVVADVCNPTCSAEPFESIAPPRGLPGDLSEPLRIWHAQNDGDTWSESWLLLKEMLEFDWQGKTIRRQAIVDARCAHLFAPGQKGFPYAQWPAGLGIGYAEAGSGVQVTWEESYAEAVGPSFFKQVLPRLKSFGPPEQVRVVFWFNF